MSTVDSNHDCRQIRPLLDDLVDGKLAAAEQQRVETHLASCAACGDQLASLERLLGEVEALPRGIAPPSDLWDDIAPRLNERPPTVEVSRWHWPRQAAAAVAFMALGGILSQLLLPGGRLGDDDAEPVAVVAEANASRASKADFALAEADFLKAKEALWAAVYTSHDAASPETRVVVEHNLAVIAEAIRELRAALDADPGNPQLEGLLLAQHRSEIGLLQRLARATEI